MKKNKESIEYASHEEFTAWAKGELVLSIGRGELDSVLWKILFMRDRWVQAKMGKK